MQAPQRLNHIRHLINISQANILHLLHDFLLQVRVTVQELLNDLAVDKPEGTVGRAGESSECAELAEWEAAQRVELVGYDFLEGDEEVLVFGVDQGE